jgi:hypothetical protein
VIEVRNNVELVDLFSHYLSKSIDKNKDVKYFLLFVL